MLPDNPICQHIPVLQTFIYLRTFQDFQIAQLERRIARMEGQTTSEEKEELEKKIKELTKTLENRQQTFNLVDTQVIVVVVLAGGTIPGVMRSLQGLHTVGGGFACRFLIRVWVIVLSASNCAKMRRNLKLTETN